MKTIWEKREIISELLKTCKVQRTRRSDPAGVKLVDTFVSIEDIFERFNVILTEKIKETYIKKDIKDIQWTRDMLENAIWKTEMNF